MVSFICNKIAKAKNQLNEVIWPLWNNWAPLKINYFLWRASLNRIPVKKELAVKGVQMAHVTCGRCGMGEESMEHLLASCLMAHTVWWHVLVWIKKSISSWRSFF
ncbi:putative reverse transcriptase zinc-binding domain-containing protein [Helianthus annuus]|nr:putative reverse transcriptase zinc-binding domain-containing protein [Helianthus annuus]